MSIDTSEDQFASYWQATTTPLSLLAADLPLRAHIVIIGGGILGAATCYWLAKLGAAPVLFERTVLAHGATGRNGGFVSVGPAGSYLEALARFGSETVQDILNVTRENQTLLSQLLSEEGIGCDYSKPGSIHVALDDEQWDHLLREANALQASGIQAEMLDHKQLQDIIMTPLSQTIRGGRFFPEDAMIHPIKLVQGLIVGACRYGARVYRTTVMGLKPENMATRIYTTQGTLSAEKVLVATNAWISELLPSFADLITPVRGQMLSYAPLPLMFPVGMSASLTSTGEYWHQRADGAVLLGGCRAAAPGYDVGMRQSGPTQEVQMALETILPRLFPQLSHLQVQHRWAGPMAFTPDFLPIADQIADLSGVWVVGGFSGHGMPFGVSLGQLLAKAIITGASPESLHLFRLDRSTLQTR